MKSNLFLDFDDEKFEKEIKGKFFQKRDERKQILGEEQALNLEKRLLLQIIDQSWKSHIQYLEQLRGVIGLRSYGNKDPLIEYKKEAFSLFENLLNKLKTDLITVLLNLKIVEQVKQNEDEIKTQQFNKEDLKRLASKKIGRNEPCPCKSGKKFKYCCGAL